MPLEFGIEDNDFIQGKIASLKDYIDLIVIEMIASYGMPVGESVFQTCVWIGRFVELGIFYEKPTTYIYRKDEKMNICHSMKAKDSNIRQALIDRFGVVGTKNKPRLVLWI